MSGYVLVRTSDRAYVTLHGASSYTHNLRLARIYPTAEAADADRCKGNERVESVVEQLMEPSR